MLRSVAVATVSVCLLGSLTGCQEALRPIDEASMKLVQLEPPKEGQDTAIIETTKGTIKILLYPEYAPNTVAFFKQLVNEGFYKNNRIFTVYPDLSFVTGSSDGKGAKGKQYNDKPIDMEYSDNIWPFTGTVCSISAKERQGDSRFFINGSIDITADLQNQMTENKFPQKVVEGFDAVGGIPGYSRRFTVFGQVYEGFDVVQSILKEPVEDDKETPKNDLFIQNITLSQYKDGELSEEAEAQTLWAKAKKAQEKQKQEEQKKVSSASNSASSQKSENSK